MASIGIHPAAKLLRSPSFLPTTNNNNRFQSRNPNFPTRKHSLSASIVLSHQTMVPVHHHHREGSIEPASDSRNKTDDRRIDSWVQNSVPDIVKNLKHAPLLVQMYSEIDGKIKVETEKAVAEEWSVARDEWRSGESRSPDVLIFVEELERERSGNEEGMTQAWGIVVQCKGAECVPACYLLKTDRVCAGIGLPFSSYVSLMRVNSFKDSAFEILGNGIALGF